MLPSLYRTYGDERGAAARREAISDGGSVQVTSLASGSSGNALVIQHGGQALLVDCGIAPRKLAALLREAGTPPADLSAVLITHEHSDHIAGVNVLPRASEIPLYMSPGTRRANPRVAGMPIFESRSVVEQPVGSTRTIGAFEVTSFPVSHDGEEVCGYLVEAGGRAVAVFTDLGIAEPHLTEPLSRAELIVIEANHDEQMLRVGPYPWHLKKRVAGPRGHLSNLACAELLCDILPERGREVWLAHLSRTNNRDKIASDTVSYAFSCQGRRDGDHTIRVMPQHGTALRWQPSAKQLALGI